jgi:putative transposase
VPVASRPSCSNATSAPNGLVATLAEMYVQGVSTRKVKAITEELCGHAFSASSISAINRRLDESLAAFARRPSKSLSPT